MTATFDEEWNHKQKGIREGEAGCPNQNFKISISKFVFHVVFSHCALRQKMEKNAIKKLCVHKYDSIPQMHKIIFWKNFPKFFSSKIALFLNFSPKCAIGKRSYIDGFLQAINYDEWHFSFRGKMLKRSAKTSQNGRRAADFLTMIHHHQPVLPHLISFRHSLKKWLAAQ